MRTRNALAWFVVIAASLSIGSVASAQRRGAPRGRAAAARTPARPSNYSTAIGGDLNGVEWGWTREQLMRYFRERIQVEFHDRLRRAPGAIEEDRVRAEMNEKIRTVRESYFEFDGRVSGYDSSFLRDEFTHNNQESMMRVQNADSDDYYFFIQGRLWKLYRAFHTRVFAGVDFEGFSAALEGRYGPAAHKNGALTEGGRETQWLEWQDEKTRARAVDNNAFFGFYCLVFEDLATVARIAELRPHRRAAASTRNALIDSVTHDDPDREVQDPHSDVVDRMYRAQRGDAGVSNAPANPPSAPPRAATGAPPQAPPSAPRTAPAPH